MIVPTSLTVAEVIKIMNTFPIKDFLISIAASSSWDAIKGTVSHLKKNSVEKIIWDIFSDTMLQFYGQLHYEYNEEIVVGCLLEELAQVNENLTSWNFQKCLERAIYGEVKTLSDREFSLWVSIFATKCTEYPEIFQMYRIEKEMREAIFTKRKLLLQRISAKIRIVIGDEDHSDELFLPIIENVRMIFRQSWKEEILFLLTKLPPLVDNLQEIESLEDLVCSNEDCKIVLDALKRIYFLHDSTKVARELKTQIREKLRYPHFDKVLIITGQTGSGKTYFVNEFLEEILKDLDDLEDKIIPCIIDISKMENEENFECFFSKTFSNFIGVNLDSLENINQVLKEIKSKVCFVFDGISNHFSSQEEWTRLIQEIKIYSKYDQLRWIITIDEYDYYYLENDKEFIDKYCLTWTEITQCEMGKGSLFRNVFSTDQYNKENGIIGLILRDKYGIDENELQNLSLTGISTPKEAIIFGEIVSKGVMIGFPSTYFEYLQNITLWKNSELVSICGNSINQVLFNVVKYIAINLTDELDEEKCDKENVVPLRKVQLVRPEFRREANIFSLSQGKTMIIYRLNIYPFWAIKLTSTISQDMAKAIPLLIKFPKDMQQFLVPSFIFYNYEKHAGDTNELAYLFKNLDNENLLIYALFSAHRASPKFSNIFYRYLYINMTSYVNSAQKCYSVLYFVFNSMLKMREKLELLNKIEHSIPQYGFQDIYERIFWNVISLAQAEKKFKKNISVVAKGEESVINYINGINAAAKYLTLPSVSEKEIEMIIWDIINYIEAHQLISTIDINIGKNESFIDFFTRRCFENYVFKNINVLQTIYQRFEKFFELEKPYGHFVKRNLTCAMGNIFSNMYNQEYNKLYIKLTKEMAESKKKMDRVTAFFLIENSVSVDNRQLYPDLREILIKLSKDKDVFVSYSERIKKLLK